MNAKTGWPLALLLVTPFDPSLFSHNSCLSNAFYGNYQQGVTTLSVLRPEPACLDTWTAQTLAPSVSIAEATREIQQLVWLEEQAVDESLTSQTRSFRHEFDAFLDTLSTRPWHSDGPLDQVVLSDAHGRDGYEVLYRTSKAALLSVSHNTARIIDTLVPRFWKSTLLPTSPVPFQPVKSSALGHAEDVLAKLKFDPVIASIVGNISISQMRNDIRFLTGEDGKSGIVSRHSFAPGALTAASWLKTRFEETGATCKLKPFLPGFAPNVVCRYAGVVNTTSTVLFSAHYDSRGSFGSTRAPGANDDGSGTVALLSIARTIRRKGIKFYSNVELVAFAGEEQGLLGSKAYARELRDANANLTLMVQADMLAYRDPGEPRQLGLPDLIGSPIVTQLVANVSAIYSPELHVGFTPACCSDHQSFHEQGFPATQVFERAGPIKDPMYHNSGDLSNRVGYDFMQLKAIAKVQFATLLHTAGYELPSEH
ncbi:putative peptidase family M28 [Lyophyllum shimeji]|uniref:Peptide hydrolase n=1 Tax=Lyophyllum shimeji TaxID=47721 RepID=A0A9P3UK40_LYOSH|nr:putative peptidase family M28 [Lyophyllum shimeji]